MADAPKQASERILSLEPSEIRKHPCHPHISECVLTAYIVIIRFGV